MEYINWIIENWETIVAVITRLITIASAICAVTKTPKDDEFISVWKLRLYKLIEIIALNIGKAKQ